jgi:DNA primase
MKEVRTMAPLKEEAATRFREVFAHYSDSLMMEASLGFTSSCPIHGGDDLEHFSWRDDLRKWTCFSDGCGVGQDVIAFVMAMEKKGYHPVMDKLKELMDKPVSHAVEVVTAPPFDKEKAYVSGTKMNQDTGYLPLANVISSALDEGTSGESWPEARYILEERGLTLDTVRHFKLGIGNKVTSPMCMRIMIPVHSLKGKLMGAQGRSFLDGTPGPKYLNYGAMDGGGFPRSRVVYNLVGVPVHRPLLLVEGPICVMRAHQAGYADAVATFGAHVSTHQMRLLGKRGHTRIILAFDRDKATLLPELRSRIAKVWPSIKIAYFPWPEGNQDVAGMKPWEFWNTMDRVDWPE